MIDLIGYVYEDAAYHRECFPYADLDPDDEAVRAVSEQDADAETLVCEACLYPLLACEDLEDEEEGGK